MFVYSYNDFTITQINGTCYITYPNEIEPSIYTNSLDNAYRFIDEMVRGE